MTALLSVALPAEVPFTTPTVDYALTSPMLIVFGTAIVGVLTEAFAPRRARFGVQLGITLTGLVAALVAVVALGVTDRRGVTAGVGESGAVVVDGPALFLQGTILVLAAVAVLTMAERSVDPGGPFTPQAAAVPGSPAEAQARRAGLVQTEVFPLMLFSVGGMLLFPASNDL